MNKVYGIKKHMFLIQLGLAQSHDLTSTAGCLIIYGIKDWLNGEYIYKKYVL